MAQNIGNMTKEEGGQKYFCPPSKERFASPDALVANFMAALAATPDDEVIIGVARLHESRVTKLANLPISLHHDPLLRSDQYRIVRSNRSPGDKATRARDGCPCMRVHCLLLAKRRSRRNCKQKTYGESNGNQRLFQHDFLLLFSA
ncbi:MAG: hypothetical protein JWO50_206 [Candidatus Kaiserbacteria bacterium]|nr:hypothetical protein [Candidatus Kaiserbacteria bacterium]